MQKWPVAKAPKGVKSNRSSEEEYKETTKRISYRCLPPSPPSAPGFLRFSSHTAVLCFCASALSADQITDHQEFLIRCSHLKIGKFSLDRPTFQFGEIFLGGPLGDIQDLLSYSSSHFKMISFSTLVKWSAAKRLKSYCGTMGLRVYSSLLTDFFRWSTRLYRSPGDSSLHDCSGNSKSFFPIFSQRAKSCAWY